MSMASLGALACARSTVRRGPSHAPAAAPSATPPPVALEPSEPPTIERESAPAEPPPSIGPSVREVGLPAGRSRVPVAVTPGRFVSIVVFGEPDSLRHFELDGAPEPEALDEDHLLPHVASFLAPAGVSEVEVDLEVKTPVTLARVELDALAPGKVDARAPPPPMIGMPAPATRDDGYLLGASPRYQFARLDVVMALRDAFARTRARFRRDPIALYDVSQWNGVRPASDVGKPRHISHAGGRDADIALPAADDEPSTMRHHCDGVLEDGGRSYRCLPGTARGLDAERLAFLLGRLAKGGRVQAIFLDREFFPAVAAAADALVAKRWLDAKTAALLGDGGLLHHAGWHTDHVHVRFTGRLAPKRFE